MNVVIIGGLGFLFLITLYIILLVLKISPVVKSWVWVRKLFGKSLIEQANTACPTYKFSDFGYDKDDDRLWDIIAGDCPVTPKGTYNTYVNTWTQSDKEEWIKLAASNCAPRYPAELLRSGIYSNDDIYKFASTVPCPKGDAATWSTAEGAWWDNMIKTRCSTFNIGNFKTNQNKVDFVALNSCTPGDDYTKKLALAWCPELPTTTTMDVYNTIAYGDHTCRTNCTPVCVSLVGKTFTHTPVMFFIFDNNLNYTINGNIVTIDNVQYIYSVVNGVEQLISSFVAYTGPAWTGDCNAPCSNMISGTSTDCVPVCVNLVGKTFIGDVSGAYIKFTDDKICTFSNEGGGFKNDVKYTINGNTITLFEMESFTSSSTITYQYLIKNGHECLMFNIIYKGPAWTGDCNAPCSSGGGTSGGTNCTTVACVNLVGKQFYNELVPTSVTTFLSGGKYTGSYIDTTTNSRVTSAQLNYTVDSGNIVIFYNGSGTIVTTLKYRILNGQEVLVDVSGTKLIGPAWTGDCNAPCASGGGTRS